LERFVHAHLAQARAGACLALLLHHHGIGTRRNLPAREDAGRSARLQRRAHDTGRDALRDIQHRAGRRHIGHAQRVPIHRGVVGRRHVQRGPHVGRQHAPQRIEGRHRLLLIDAMWHRAGH
jgi:hypothetical protein